MRWLILFLFVLLLIGGGMSWPASRSQSWTTRWVAR
jgi:hypothetical protein